MPDVSVEIVIPEQNVPEVRAALQQHMGLSELAGVEEFQAFVKSQVKSVVLKYRESQRADIDRSDPTALPQ